MIRPQAARKTCLRIAEMLGLVRLDGCYQHAAEPNRNEHGAFEMAKAPHATNPSESKVCAGCGVTFVKPERMYPSKWRRRTYCGFECVKDNSRSRDARQRFEEKVDREPGHGPRGDCHIWTAHRDKNGYGHFQMWTKSDLAHRVAFFMATGIHPGDAFVCHECDNPSCVNPDHLWLGSALDNNVDAISKGRAKPQSGERHTSAKLTDDDVRAIRKDSRSGAAIARDYGVSDVMILRIKAGVSWKGVT